MRWKSLSNESQSSPIRSGMQRALSGEKSRASAREAGFTAMPSSRIAHRIRARRYIELSDVICPNETELALLCKGDIDTESEESVQAGARELIARGTLILAQYLQVYCVQVRRNV